MLSELRIENLAVIPGAELVFSPGLNVITGETGAGKTILAHAISLLLGARAASGLIRPGAAEASVEAIFQVPVELFQDLEEDIDLPPGQELIVRRRISREGQSRAYLSGRATTLAVLGQVTGRLLAFSAQHEQRRLMMASRQMEILDEYTGAPLLDLKQEFELNYDRRAAVLSEIERLREGSEARAREAELLAFQAAEIEAAGLVAGEDGLLEAEVRRLSAVMELKQSAGALSTILGSGSDDSGESLIDTLGGILKELQESAGIDAGLDEIAGRLESSFLELEEVGRAARDYGEGLASDPERLVEAGERLELIAALKRKYGAGIEEVNDYCARASQKLSSLTNDLSARPRLDKELTGINAHMLDVAGAMRSLRLEAAKRLEVEAASQLADLAFGRCVFEARVTPLDEFTRSGADAVEFLVSPNPGMPATPIRDTASGGELSRIMLAIKTCVSSGAEAATLVFDEIDAGIGGETGLAVGAKLKKLAGASQVICITHLPQIACFGDANFSVVKHSGEDHTATGVTRLEPEECVDELCRMMGSAPADEAARAHANSLLSHPGKTKASAGGKR